MNKSENIYEDEIRAASEAWWNLLTEAKRKQVFIELLVGNQAGAHYIFMWYKENRASLS